MVLPAAHAEFDSFSKQQLHELADQQLTFVSLAIEYCVEFVLAESKGLWHGRARAIMCRRLKHCKLGRTHRTKLVACILGRLQSGEFSEQFKDQLRLALHLDSKQVLEACERVLPNPKPHVGRYVTWIISLPRGKHAA